MSPITGRARRDGPPLCSGRLIGADGAGEGGTDVGVLEAMTRVVKVEVFMRCWAALLLEVSLVVVRAGARALLFQRIRNFSASVPLPSTLDCGRNGVVPSQPRGLCGGGQHHHCDARQVGPWLLVGDVVGRR